MTTPTLPRIAIVGMGGLYPSRAGAPASGPEQLWADVLAGVDTAQEVPAGRWLLAPEQAFDPRPGQPDRVYSRRGCFLAQIPENTNPSPPIPLSQGERGGKADLDPLFHLTLHVGRQAWAAAVTAPLDRNRVGVILGNIALPTERSAALAWEILGRTLAERLGSGLFSPVDPTQPLNRYVAGLPAALLARHLGLGGGCVTLDAACASSLYAVYLGAAELRAGRLDAVLAGGVSRPDCLYTQMGFSQLRALSPTGRAAPFDAAGDGLVVGEGAGIFVLKRLDDALRHGDTILAVLAGGGLSNDLDGGLLAPNSDGQLRAMRAAYAAAGWSPEDVDLVECHATGTPVGDAVEFASLRRLWEGAAGNGCVLGSVKSNVGHLLTAAGAAGLTKVLFALRQGVLPPTAHFTRPAPGVTLSGSPFRVLREPETWKRRGDGVPRRAALSGFGFGGINAHLLLEEWLPQKHPLTSDPSPPRGEGSLPSDLAVVGLGAAFGPWQDLAAFCDRVFGNDPRPPRPPTRWWGVDRAEWFRTAGLSPDQFLGHYVEAVRLGAARYRIPPRELAEMLPQQLLMLRVADEALSAAGHDAGPHERAGAFVGLGLDLNTTQFHLRWAVLRVAREWARRLVPTAPPKDVAEWEHTLVEATGPALNANRTMGALGSIAASRVARAFRLGGPSFTVCSEDSSGLRAFEMAGRALQRGDLDVALVGAVDLAGDVRSALATRACGDSGPVGEGAAAVVLMRRADAERAGRTIYAVVRGCGVATGDTAVALALERASAEAGLTSGTPAYRETTDTLRADLGHTGAASGLAALVKACLALHLQTLPPRLGTDALSAARHWLRDRHDGPRRAAVSASSIDGTGVGVVLEEHAASAHTPRPTSYHPREALFVVRGDDVPSLLDGLARLGSRAEQAAGLAVEDFAREWVASTGQGARALALVARAPDEVRSLVHHARQALTAHPRQALPGPGLPAAARDRLFFTPEPLGPAAEVAFVFPGSGNDFPGMGRELALWRPEVLRRQDAENEHLRSQFLPRLFWRAGSAAAPRQRIMAQVALGTLVADLFARVGVRPRAVLGHSLGESAALFALRAWTDRDGMLARMERSPLFQTDLVGRCDAARAFWGIPPDQPVDWLAGVVAAPVAALRAACAAVPDVFLLVLNTPDEGVVGGRRPAVETLVRNLGRPFVPLPDTATVHCPVARLVADAYRELHRLPTTPPAGVRFYSTAQARAYDLDSDTAAEAILAQALDTIDFPAVVESAYRDGARFFVEMGPGNSCTRFIGAILEGRPHRARSACVPGGDEVGGFLRVLALLAAEGFPVDLAALSVAAPRLPSLPVDSQAVAVRVGGEPFVLPTLPACPATVEPPPTALTPIPAVRSGPALVARDLAPQLTQTLATLTAAQEAQGAFLRFSANLQEAFAAQVAFQTTLLEAMVLGGSVEIGEPRFEVGRIDHPSYLEHPLAGAAGLSNPLAGAAGLSASQDAVPRSLDRAACLEFAIGSIGKVLGSAYAPIDAFPTRVRLPDEPLMLVDRILTIEGEPLSLTCGRVVTEHDVLPGAWYLDGGRIPTCLAVESGQADLFLSGFLGIDFHTHGLAVYRLLDAVVTFHRGLPGPGRVIRYDIHIDQFFRQGDTHLFRFRFVGTVDGEPLLTMTDGCAGFFGPAELAAGKGIVQTALDRRPQKGVVPDDASALPPQEVASYDDEQIDALRRGDLSAAFGPVFAGLPLLGAGLRLPGGRLRLVHRVPHLDPTGGRFGVGLIRGEADIHPDDWFLTCHFVDDQVMPGTLMYECCLHTLRVFLLRLGWVSEDDGVACEPVPGAAGRLRCRGQVTAATRTVTYEVTVKERGYRPEPYALVDALMSADGRPIVECLNMSLRLVGLTREAIEQTWQKTAAPRAPRYGPDRILAFAVGKPSEAFGEPYRVFDRERVIARLPGPPFLFLERVVHVEGEPFRLAAGAACVTEYDIPPEAWYFTAERQQRMPFAVLLEAALQPCGWLAAYAGSALTSPTDLSFRNLGGSAQILADVTPETGTLRASVRLTRVSHSAGMIIQHYDFEVRDPHRVVYRGDTSFGYFSKEALAQQVGLRDVRPYEPDAGERARGRSFPFPRQAPFPDDRLRMMDRVDLLVADGGPHGLGLVLGSKTVAEDEWFFRAHFYQDPVWPGSLGLEAFLQLLKVVAADRWPDAGPAFVPSGAAPHRWIYRGQVLPQSREVQVQAVVTAVDDRNRRLTAEGLLLVDGRVIYKMTEFSLSVAGDAVAAPGVERTRAGRAQHTP